MKKNKKYDKSGKYCVYRYIDKDDGIVKYIGISKKGRLGQRLKDHRNDKIGDNIAWRIEYFDCNNQAEAEAFEAHLIAKYHTDKYFNVVKAGWGINRFLPDETEWWTLAEDSPFEDSCALRLVKMIKQALRKGDIEFVEEALNMLEIVGLDNASR